MERSCLALVEGCALSLDAGVEVGVILLVKHLVGGRVAEYCSRSE